MAATQVYDAIVIGAGASGCFAAKELTEGGLTVLLLDAGPEIHPVKDFPVPPPRNRWVIDRVVPGFLGQHIQNRCLPFNRTTGRFYVSDADNPYTTPPGKPFNWFRGRQVGGRLHTWGRVALRFSDWELKPSIRNAKRKDWPISYRDLAPFYDRVERFLGVHGTYEHLPHLPDGEFIPPRSISVFEQYARDEIAAKWRNRRFIAARVTRHNPSRIPLPLVAAMQTGRLTVRANAVVRYMQMDVRGSRARAVSFVDRITNRPANAEARVFVICASAIESVRILLNSACQGHPGGVGNSSGLLGRFLMDHCMVTVTGTVPEKLFKAYGRTTVDPNNDPYDLAANYIYMPGFRNITESASPFAGSYGFMGSVGRLGRKFHLVGFGEMLPHFENRVSTNPKVRDAWDIPAAHIECTHLDNERALIADMRAAVEQMVKAAALEVRRDPSECNAGIRGVLNGYIRDKVWTSYGAYHPGAAIHELGGACMGDDPRDSVLNSFNQCWDVPNLFVTDGACFVTSGYQSPTLTIMALTVRACDFIITQTRTGDL